MNVEVLLTGAVIAEEDLRGHTVVVIDVLRTSSTIAAALKNGARAVIPVPDTETAGKIGSSLDPSSVLLGGERAGEKIEGYLHGNSPLEYTPEVVGGKTLILNTTNGTRAVSAARSAEHLLIGGFMNVDAVVEFIRQAGNDLTIICAGWRNRVALEDTLAAGMMLYHLWEGREPGIVSDAAHIAFTQYRNDKDTLQRTLHRCNHAQWLAARGFEEDVAYCFTVNGEPVLPYFRDNRLTLLKDSAYPTKAA